MKYVAALLASVTFAAAPALAQPAGTEEPPRTSDPHTIESGETVVTAPFVRELDIISGFRLAGW